MSRQVPTIPGLVPRGIGDMPQSGLGRGWGVFQKPSLHLSMQA
jgi:hypothetical protein